ncbi:MAG: hypothetical protein VKP63_03820 [Cyanobacteriota bacterium]|nr:hypothetical protein [Cyanobacteriota bacterium]
MTFVPPWQTRAHAPRKARLRAELQQLGLEASTCRSVLSLIAVPGPGAMVGSRR